MRVKKHWYTDVTLLGVFASWGLAFLVIKAAMETGGFTPMSFLWPRMALSTVVIFVMMPVFREPLHIPREHLMKTVVIGVLGIGVYHVLFMIGLKLTTPVDTALIMGATPVMTAIWMPVFGLERTRLRAWLGIAICFVAVAAIAVSGAAPVAQQAGWDWKRLLGDVLMAAASNCWALNGILCRKAMRFLRPATVTAYGALFASAALLPVCAWAMLRQDWSAVTPKGWLCLLYAVLPASTLSMFFFYLGVRNVGPLHTIVYQNIAPIVTGGAVFLTEGEVPTIVQVVGILTIFIGVTLTRTSQETAHVTREGS
jgi:drug/metabolite transporter (DMT)-like permease